MIWDLALIMPFLIYLAVVMPFRLCFANEAAEDTGIYWFEFIIDLVMIALSVSDSLHELLTAACA